MVSRFKSKRAKKGKNAANEEKKLDYTFVAMPYCIIFDDRFNRYDKLVYMHLVARAVNDRREVTCCQDTLSTDTGLSVSKVKQSLVVLENAALIKVYREHNKCNRYIIVAVEDLYSKDERKKLFPYLRHTKVHKQKKALSLKRRRASYANSKAKENDIFENDSGSCELTTNGSYKKATEKESTEYKEREFNILSNSQPAADKIANEGDFDFSDEVFPIQEHNKAADAEKAEQKGCATKTASGKQTKRKRGRPRIIREDIAETGKSKQTEAKTDLDELGGSQDTNRNQEAIRGKNNRNADFTDFWDIPDSVDTESEKAAAPAKKTKYSERRNKLQASGLSVLARMHKAKTLMEEKKAPPKKSKKTKKTTKRKTAKKRENLNELPIIAELGYSNTDASKKGNDAKPTDVAVFFREKYKEHIGIEFPASVPRGLEARNSPELGGWKHVLNRYGWDKLTKTIEYMLQNWSKVAGRLNINSYPNWNMFQSFKIMDSLVVEAQMGQPKIVSRYEQMKAQTVSKVAASQSPDCEQWRHSTEGSWDNW